MNVINKNLKSTKNTMTNDIMASSLSSNYAPANYRSADVFGGNYPINTPSGMTNFVLDLLI